MSESIERKRGIGDGALINRIPDSGKVRANRGVVKGKAPWRAAVCHDFDGGAQVAPDW